MFDKIKSLLGSIRFWIVTLAWASAYLSGIDAEGFQLIGLFDGIALWLGTVAGIGTLDSIATKFGKK